MAKKVVGKPQAKLKPTSGQNGRTVKKTRESGLSAKARNLIRVTLREVKRLGFLSNHYWAEDNLERALSKMERGEETDHRGVTPYHDVPRDKVIAMWNPILGKVVRSRLSSTYAEKLLILEQDQAENISVQSKYKPFSQDGVEKLKRYFNVKNSYPLDKTAWLKTLDWAKRLVKSRSLHSLSADEVWNNTTEGEVSPASDTMDSNTHSGGIHYQHGWKVSPSMSGATLDHVRIVQDWLRPAAEEYYDRILRGESVANVTNLFQRLAQKKDPAKVKRLVFAVWKPAVLALKRFVPSLQDVFRNLLMPSGVPVGIGLSDPLNSDLACQKALDHALKSKRAVLGLDYSAFDASQSYWLNSQVYDVWSEWFDNGGWLINFAKQMYTNHYIISPVGVFKPRTIGGPSGLTDTLIRNSFISLLVAKYGYYAGHWDDLQTAMFLGDDGEIDAAGLTADRYSKVAAEFGLVMNAEKSFQEPGMMHWLQRLHCTGLLGGMMPTMRMLGSLMSHERSVDIGPKGILEVIRAYGSVDNCSEHPAFDEFVKFVAKGDKGGLMGSQDSMAMLKSDKSGQMDDKARSLDWALTSQKKPITELSSYDAMAVRWVLKGGSMPPIGSYERFVRSYGEERVQKNVHPALRDELAYWKSKG
uniref:Putative replicase n=1 Tax=Mutsystermes virus TaxID=2796618 RepID=A0A7T7K8Q7_9VIRU|nr:putative replicase [Mutsystermes virus]